MMQVLGGDGTVMLFRSLFSGFRLEMLGQTREGKAAARERGRKRFDITEIAWIPYYQIAISGDL
tara:strand:+ start:168 stop:359 length:192 start_codon:yes stop_codon:yes gene_type:complete